MVQEKTRRGLSVRGTRSSFDRRDQAPPVADASGDGSGEATEAKDEKAKRSQRVLSRGIETLAKDSIFGEVSEVNLLHEHQLSFNEAKSPTTLLAAMKWGKSNRLKRLLGFGGSREPGPEKPSGDEETGAVQSRPDLIEVI